MPKASVFIKFIAVIVMIFAAITTSVFADESGSAFFVLDDANIISDKLEAEIAEKGEVILAQSGCRFAVAAVDFLGGKDIEQFCRELYIGNSMGDNGILLLFSVAEENYHVIRGEKLKDKLSDSALKKILDKYVENAFEAGEYEAAVKAAHDEITERLEEIYSITSDKEQYLRQLHEIELANQKTAKTKKIYNALFIASVLAATLFLIKMAVSFYYYFKRRRR